MNINSTPVSIHLSSLGIKHSIFHHSGQLRSLEQAAKEGEVRIVRKDGTVFVIKPQPRAESPLDVEGVDLELTAEEIVEFVRESRERPSQS